jgi:hypothetical protein
MATVTDITTARKHNVTRYAYLGDLYGTAELLNGTGYLFRAEGQRKATLVSYRDPELRLLGVVQDADAQYVADLAAGGAAAICTNRQMEVA